MLLSKNSTFTQNSNNEKIIRQENFLYNELKEIKKQIFIIYSNVNSEFKNLIIYRLQGDSKNNTQTTVKSSNFNSKYETSLADDNTANSSQDINYKSDSKSKFG